MPATIPLARGSLSIAPTIGGSSVGVVELLDEVPDTGAALPCRVNDPDLWFADSPAQLEQAKALCASCPVKAACLAGALARREPWGVWGGEIFERGVIIARKRPRGRPRKEERVAKLDTAPARTQEVAA